MSDTRTTEFDLFISHSSGDRLVTVHGRHFRLIDHLKSKLEDHYHPTEQIGGRPRRFRVCTFEEDFQLTGDVRTAIESQLGRSRAVLVICSEAAMDSRYVHSEVGHFQAACPDRPLIAGFWNVLPDKAFPEFFADDTIGANLRPSIVASFDDWVQQLEDECHKVVAQAWGLELKEVHDRFVSQLRKKRRRFLIAAAAVLLVVAGIGGLALHQWRSIRRANAHRAAVLQVKEHGFQVDSRGAAGGNTLVFTPPGGSKFAEPAGNHATRGLEDWAADLMDVRSVRLSGAPVTDRTIAALAPLARLGKISLLRANVTDASIGSLLALTGLEELHLDRTRITDEGLSRLREGLPGCSIDSSVERFVDLTGWDLTNAVPADAARPERGLSANEWRRVLEYAEENASRFGYPERREDSLLLASFNIRKLSDVAFRTPEAWLFLAKVLHGFDLIAVQEVLSDLEGVRHLHDLLGPGFELTYSPPSGPIQYRERVVFFHNRQTVRRTEVTGNILLDARSIKTRLAENWAEFGATLDEWDVDRRQKKARGRRWSPSGEALPVALGFMRTPFMTSFELGREGTQIPYRILAVNAHLEYASDPKVRRNGFDLLVELLLAESVARRKKQMGYEDLVLLGDLNLDYDRPERDRERVGALLDSLTENEATAAQGGGTRESPAIRFPFLDPHPGAPPPEGVWRTNILRNQTYDQIGFVAHDPRLAALDSSHAGQREGGFDYGVFDWICLFLGALPEEDADTGGRPIDCDLGEDAGEDEARRLKARLRNLTREKRVDFDVSDHLPIWVRLPAPE